jgi:hypothetical protein
MTLKCKIKEISEIQTQNEFEKAAIVEQDFSDSAEDLSDDDFQLQEVGTIEQIHKTQKKTTRRNESKYREKNSKPNEKDFYDKNSIGRKPSQKKEWIEFEEPQKKIPQKSQKSGEKDLRKYD